MDSIFNFQFGTFSDSSPNWFDWFSLIANYLVSIIAIIGGFQIAKNIYNKERKDKEADSQKLNLAEFKLFSNSLQELKSAVDNQKKDIDSYLQNLDFKLVFYQNVNIDFLQFIDPKNLYLHFGLGNDDKISAFNDLLKRLYLLNDFRESLRNEFRAYNEKYNYHEKKFYSYRELLYSRFYKLSNRRSINIIVEEGRKKWQYNDKDKFMLEYSQLLEKTLSDNEIFENNGLKSRKLLNERFIIVLVLLSAKYIPDDYNAIEVNEIANQVVAAFNDMEHATDVHIGILKNHSENLRISSEKISSYLT